MTLLRFLFIGLVGLFSSFFYSSCFANSATSNPIPPENVTRIVISLVLVVGVLIALSVAFKKFGLNRIYASLPVKVIGAISIGSNQRIMVIEAGDEWVVLGVTPQNISTLTRMPRQEIAADDANINSPKLPNWLHAALKARPKVN